jgi:hypothetical protein
MEVLLLLLLLLLGCVCFAGPLHERVPRYPCVMGYSTARV